ncbi:MAG: hypothetical protein E7396_00865 [Ruminococcaceae bacterium]|nr:hypothetical protein [Oscillospiraceae bacterium]
MLIGNVTVKEFVDEMTDEIDVSLPQIKKKQYYDWINAELFHIYSSAVRCIGVNQYKTSTLMIDLNKPYLGDGLDFDIGFDPYDPIKPEFENCSEDIDTIMYEDICKVFSLTGNEYARSTYGSLMAKGNRFYYKVNGKLVVNLYESDGIYKVMFYMRPKKITEENAEEYIIPLPDGFLDVIRARIRMEAFMLAGNVSMANAWSDQHILLFEELKKWYAQREADYIR